MAEEMMKKRKMEKGKRRAMKTVEH